MKISAYLIMNDATLPEASAEAARRAGGEWVIVNRRNGRMLVSCLAPEAMIQPLFNMLAAYVPQLVGYWDIDGNLVQGNMDQVPDYIDVMPDDVATTGADTPAIITRPTTARDVCFWAGWAERKFPT